MTTTGFRFSAAMFAALTLSIGAAPQANALDAFWHGVRSKLWHQGSNGEASNWYDMAPTSGNPVDVPDGTATFAPGAQRKTVVVKKNVGIKSVLFTPGNDKYSIVVQSGGRLSVTGSGIANASSQIQEFRVNGGNSRLFFKNSAVAGELIIGVKDIIIRNENFGETRFKNQSSGGDAKIINDKGGLVSFHDDADAGLLNIVNAAAMSEIHFLDNSDGNRCTIKNSKGSLTFDRSSRPVVSARKIVNGGKMVTGITDVKLKKNLWLKPSSVLKTAIRGGDIGTIIAGTTARVGGNLVVFGTKKEMVGTYVLIKSPTNILGTFKTPVVFTDFHSSVVPKIAYQGKKIVLIISKKP